MPTISKRKVGGKDLSQGVDPVLGRVAEAPKEIETDIHGEDEKEIENEEGDTKKGRIVEETEIDHLQPQKMILEDDLQDLKHPILVAQLNVKILGQVLLKMLLV